MTGGYPLGGDANATDVGAVSSSATSGTTLTANASANTYGNYSQLIAATAYDASGMLIAISNGSVSTNAQYAVAIAIGAAASEVVIIPNLIFNLRTALTWFSVFIPIGVPAGTRLSAKVQSPTGAATCEIAIELCDSDYDMTPYGLLQDYGTAIGTTRGTQLDPGAVANTKGSYAQLAASTTYDINWLLVFVSGGAGVIAAQEWLMDIAVGAAASEKIILSNLLFEAGATNPGITTPLVGAFKIKVPSGTRLSARCQCTSTTSGSRKPDVCLYGAN